MTPGQYLFFYCVLIIAASIFGGFLPSFFRITHLRMQLTMSLVSGLMLGVALLHMLPHACESLSVRVVAMSMLSGILVMFFLLRVFHVHYHGTNEEHHHDCEHSHGHEHADANTKRRLSWMGLFLGLAIHTLIDGIALGASVMADAQHGNSVVLIGMGTFLAVLLHKPLDALSITSLMKSSQWSSRSMMMVNFSFAMACPAGAALFWFSTGGITEQGTLSGMALGFSAGFFLCIALGDLLPEVQFHAHDRLRLSGALLVGIFLSFAIESLHNQGGHDHQDKSTNGNRTVLSSFESEPL